MGFSIFKFDNDKKTRNTVSNAHKMIPPSPPYFIFAYFTVGNLEINQIKMYNRMWGMSIIM